jgi:ABC-type spermidine/putrescine transport system permease subunit II
VGGATAWIIIYPLLFFAAWLATFLGTWTGVGFAGAEDGFPLFFIPFAALFPCHFLTILLQLGLMAFYLVHVIKNQAASETLRIVLGVGTFVMPYVAMPVYYYAYIWPDEPPAWAV